MDQVYEFLERLRISWDQYNHKAVFTTAESGFLKTIIPGKQCKNLFLTNDKRTKHYLVTIEHGKKADLKQLARMLKEKNLRFASADRLLQHLKLTPGSVSPLGLINDTDGSVTFLLDRELSEEEKIYCHPNTNTATIGLLYSDFSKLLASTGHEINLVDIAG